MESPSCLRCNASSTSLCDACAAGQMPAMPIPAMATPSTCSSKISRATCSVLLRGTEPGAGADSVSTRGVVSGQQPGRGPRRPRRYSPDAGSKVSRRQVAKAEVLKSSGSTCAPVHTQGDATKGVLALDGQGLHTADALSLSVSLPHPLPFNPTNRVRLPGSFQDRDQATCRQGGHAHALMHSTKLPPTHTDEG